jgi:hypothetical protein
MSRVFIGWMGLSTRPLRSVASALPLRGCEKRITFADSYVDIRTIASSGTVSGRSIDVLGSLQAQEPQAIPPADVLGVVSA